MSSPARCHPLAASVDHTHTDSQDSLGSRREAEGRYCREVTGEREVWSEEERGEKENGEGE